MINDLIGKFIESKLHKNNNVNIHFKQRETLKGVFIFNDDYEELKGKNFWRVVSGEKLEEWKRTQDNSLARIFNGADFKRLTETN
ncbi:MAG TPA: short-chain dehydrogenase [Panacibacter sp.]|nr:short-chain dehydrogenase [Panacibacter sp.]